MLKILRILLVLAGVTGVCVWLPLALAATATLGMAGGDIGSPEYWLVFVAPLVIFGSYPWVVWRSWSAMKTGIWGLVVHIPFLEPISNAAETEKHFALAALLLVAILIYAAYTYALWTVGGALQTAPGAMDDADDRPQ